MGRRKTAKHAQRGTGFDPEVLSLCRPTRGGSLSDCEQNWKVGVVSAVVTDAPFQWGTFFWVHVTPTPGSRHLR